MSAYITQLDILGFDGGAAAWTSKVNTVETGGVGGAMSAECFTIAPINEADVYGYGPIENWDIIEQSSFLTNQIRLDHIRQDNGHVEFFAVRLETTSEFLQKYPDSITVHYESNLNPDIHNGGTYFFSFTAFDQQYLLGSHYIELLEEDFPLNIEFSVPLTYRTLEEDEETPYQSDGLVSINVEDSTGFPM